jgi:hypothetical protein
MTMLGDPYDPIPKRLGLSSETCVAAFITAQADFLWHLLPLHSGRQRD